MHLPSGLFAGLTQRAQESGAVLVIQTNVLAPFTTVHKVVNSTRILDTELASDGGEANRSRPQYNKMW